MIIIYEAGDIVELDDDCAVPYNLGASTVELVKKRGSDSWEVSIIDSMEMPRTTPPYIIPAKWFNPK